MPAPHTEWTVLPHGPLVTLEAGLFTVVGDLKMPLGVYPRRMTVVRLRDGRLVIYSAIALREPEMKSLEAEGSPSFLIVPNGFHRLDAQSWKTRYPKLEVIAPIGARDAVSKVVQVDHTHHTFHDPSVTFVTVPGTGAQEAALVVERPESTTLIVNDMLWNLPDRPGFVGTLFKLGGFTGAKPRVPWMVSAHAVSNKKRLGQQFRVWSDLPRLARILVSHGEVIDHDPAGALRRCASDLGA